MSTAVLFHSDCPDGFTAAWVAFRALTRDPLERVSLYPVTHGTTPPDLNEADTVYVVDFSYPHDDLVQMAHGWGERWATPRRRVVVLDHHRTAVDDIVSNLRPAGFNPGSTVMFRSDPDDENPYECVLDVERSGAGITWDYFHPGQPRPPLVDYVEDRDLWRSALPHSREVNAYIATQPYTLEAWDTLAAVPVEKMVELGQGALAGIDAYCRNAAQYAYMCEMGGLTFPIANVARTNCSDVANYLLDHFGTDMAGYFFHRPDGRWQYGFRSRNGRTVHEFAKSFGGGGHPQAAGCEVDQIAHVRVL